MISFLIPIYNYDVSDLVYSIHNQSIECGINFEILLIDDCSTKTKDKNRELSKKEFVNYYELDKNIGRSKIRNLLASKASFDNLIFLDCDSKIITKNYVSNYVQNINELVVYAGRVYNNVCPELKYKLHWKYGTYKESQPLKVRLKFPNKSFQTNNFLIKKTIFEQIKFNENIEKYGHEDTLFGYELKKKNIEIKHIENPVEHDGLEDNTVFLEKSKLALANLKLLKEMYSEETELFSDIKILKFYKNIEKYHLKKLVEFINKRFKNLIYNNLLGKNPNLFLFDIYKLMIYNSQNI